MDSLKNLEESMGCNTIRDDHGGGVIYQRVHMDKAEFDEMLRKVEEEYSGLQAENAKLRELVRDMWQFTGKACKRYPRLFDPSAQGGQMVQPNMIDAFEQRMQELGIEVDG